MRFLAEEILDDLLHLRNAGRAADEHDFVDLRGIHAGIGERLLRRANRLLQQIVDELLELRARQPHLQVLGPALVRGDERQVDVGFDDGGELHLRLLRRLFQTLQRHSISGEIDAVALLELAGDPVDDSLIEIVTAKMRVAIGGLDFDDPFPNFEDRDIERAAAKVVHGDCFVFLLVQSIRQGRRRRLVDDAHDFEPGNLARVLRRLALRIVEVRRHREHCLGDWLSDILLRGLFELLQDHRGDFGRRVLLPVRFDPYIAVRGADDSVRHHLHLFADFVVAPAHEALDREHRVLGIGDCLTLGDLTDEAFAALGERDN